ncbi:MAG TPA: cytochrome d ubiquinol oxidase subunit II [Solirubrobacterales bacterium]|jgi:cytochrome d ubiquinol oxidase subunit II
MPDVSFLQGLWFVLICVLWLGYFVLEGFDFGVGMLLRAAGKNDAERRAVIHSIGPVWDGNEVWLLTAGGATFAAFPVWYATLFSGFYLALFLILGALIVRGVAFEFWGKRDDPVWRKRWEWALIGGSAVPALLWGVAWANIVDGVPIDASGEYTGTLFDLLGPYALLGGLATLAIFLAHGALFLALRTKGEVEQRARRIAGRSTPVAAGLGIAFLAWTIANQGDRGGVEVVSAALAAGAAVALLAAARLARDGVGKAFAATSAGIVLLFVALFADLFPAAMVSSTDPAFSIPLAEASSGDYTLTVMSIVALVLVPVVLAYQAWTYWVFRARIGAEDFGDVRTPMDLLERKYREPAHGEEEAGKASKTEPTGAPGS